MRKVWSALAGAVVIALAVAGVASAVNTYDVHVASTSPGNEKGSKSEADARKPELRLSRRRKR